VVINGERYRHTTWAVSGAVAFVLAGFALAWLGAGPDHTRWTDSAIFMAPLAAVVGAAVGFLAAVLHEQAAPKREGS
jgi:NhaP-type Na+/H+ or K+/H+ antiporter